VRRLLLLLFAAALGGCGLLIDPIQGTDAGNPPVGMDAQVGVDAGATDAGPAPQCAEDDECDDGVVCNGSETCDFGRCRAGTPIVCDDGVGCTEDTCDEAAGGCVSTPRDARCAEPALECAESFCDAALGCQRRLRDDLCDDGVECTIDRCAPGGCESLSDDAFCDPGEYCEPPAADAAAPGCRPIPECETASDCPHRVCNAPPSCVEGACVYTEIANDPGCYSSDECVPIGCDSGRCVAGLPVSCATSDAASCTREVCSRSEAGLVSCVSVARDGESCVPSMPCHSGVCAGTTCVETALCIASSDPCESTLCDVSGGCTTVRNTCGTNSSCDSADGACACDPGWVRCSASDLDCSCPAPVDAGRPDAGFDAGRRDAGLDAGAGVSDGGRPDGGTTTSCLMGEADCDGDGRCECVLGRSRCLAGACICPMTCPMSTRCCPLGGGVQACVLGSGPCTAPSMP